MIGAEEDTMWMLVEDAFYARVEQEGPEKKVCKE